MAALTDPDINQALVKLPGWRREGKVLTKTFDRQSFRSSMALVNTVGEIAERADHHPDMLIEYSKVTFRLWTHSAGGVTDKDLTLARQIETVAAPEPP